MAYNKLSIYDTIASELKGKITRGELKAGDVLPSENTISELYATSRVTARKAIDVLVKEGLVNTIHGKGKYVASPRASDYKIKPWDMAQDITTQMIHASVINPTDELRIRLNFDAQTKALEIKRKILKEDECIGVSYKYIRYDKKLPLLEHEFNYFSFTEPETAAKKTIKVYAAGADRDTSEDLNVEEGLPLLAMEVNVYDSALCLISLEKTYCVGDAFTLNGI